jgi:hypothetical protein
MSTSGTKVGARLSSRCASDQVNDCRGLGSPTVGVFTVTEGRTPPPVFDSGCPRASCRQINSFMLLASVWTQPLSITYAPYDCRLVIVSSVDRAPHKSGGSNGSVRHPRPHTIFIHITFIQKGIMIKIYAETNGPLASWPHPVLPFGR